jgi:hypothetical protein
VERFDVFRCAILAASYAAPYGGCTRGLWSRSPFADNFLLSDHPRPYLVCDHKGICQYQSLQLGSSRWWLRQGTIAARLGLLGTTRFVPEERTGLREHARETLSVGQTLYSFSRSGMSSLATPEIVPLKSPVAAKKTGLPRASAATVFTVSVIVRTPDA